MTKLILESLPGQGGQGHSATRELSIQMQEVALESGAPGLCHHPGVLLSSPRTSSNHLPRYVLSLFPGVPLLP